MHYDNQGEVVSRFAQNALGGGKYKGLDQLIEEQEAVRTSRRAAAGRAELLANPPIRAQVCAIMADANIGCNTEWILKYKKVMLVVYFDLNCAAA